MLKSSTMAFLLLAVAILSGCLDSEEEADPTGTGGRNATGPDGLPERSLVLESSLPQEYWNFTIESETITAKLTTTSRDVNLTVNVDEDWWFGVDHVFAVAVFDYDFYMRTSYNGEVGVGVNDVFVGTGEHGWQGSNQREIQFDEPGEYWIAVFADGTPLTVNLSVENGTIEVIKNQIATAHYYDDKHEDWDKTYITSPAGTVKIGTLRLAPISETMQIHSLTMYHHGSTELELVDDVCEGMGLMSASTGGEAVLEVEGTRTLHNPILTRVLVVHWPFEGEERGCWYQPNPS